MTHYCTRNTHYAGCEKARPIGGLWSDGSNHTESPQCHAHQEAANPKNNANRYAWFKACRVLGFLQYTDAKEHGGVTEVGFLERGGNNRQWNVVKSVASILWPSKAQSGTTGGRPTPKPKIKQRNVIHNPFEAGSKPETPKEIKRRFKLGGKKQKRRLLDPMFSWGVRNAAKGKTFFTQITDPSVPIWENHIIDFGKKRTSLAEANDPNNGFLDLATIGDMVEQGSLGIRDSHIIFAPYVSEQAKQQLGIVEGRKISLSLEQTAYWEKHQRRVFNKRVIA